MQKKTADFIDLEENIIYFMGVSRFMKFRICRHFKSVPLQASSLHHPNESANVIRVLGLAGLPPNPDPDVDHFQARLRETAGGE